MGKRDSILPGHWRFQVTKTSRTMRWLPSYAWQRATRPAPRRGVHLMIAMADHFEPSIVPTDGRERVPYAEQERRLENWCREYPLAFDSFRDEEGMPFVHTYFYPAEQYEKGLVQQLANHCHAGWGEVEVHLHHGIKAPDTEDNLRRQLVEFRDILALEHGCLCYFDGKGLPQYSFVHGNYALANSNRGRSCGVDSEIQVLAETGCYADMTLPPGPGYRTHIAKINSIYECSLPLRRRAAHRKGRSLRVGHPPSIFPLIIEGPLMLTRVRPDGRRQLGVDTGTITSPSPPTAHRLGLWKDASISVRGRPDWLFIKLQCHGMDPRDRDAMLGHLMRDFLRELVEGADRNGEIIHFVTAREMTNIILAACDGRDGNPGEYRDYRLRRVREPQKQTDSAHAAQLSFKN